MKKKIALLLSIVLMLSVVLCACSTQTEKDKLVGTWKTTVNMADAFNEEMATEPEMAEYLTLESFDIGFILVFNEDDTYSLTVDSEIMDASVEKLGQDLTDGLLRYFADVLAAQGVEMDVEDALTTMGISLEGLVEEMKAEAFSEESYSEMNAAGKFKAEDGKLYLSDSVDAEVDTADYNTYTLDGDTLTLEAGTEPDDDMVAYMYPMTLTRVK